MPAVTMFAGNVFALPLAVLLTFSNETRPSASSAEDTAPRPPTAPPAPGRWSTASWGPCSNPCGAGEERRQVSCVLEDVTSTLIVAADSFCAPPKPTAARQCYQFRSECANAWVTGDWGQCSAKCGGGQRARVVECHAGRGADGAPHPPTGDSPSSAPPTPPTPLPEGLCVEQLRPAVRRDCNLQPCPDGRRVWLRTSDGRRPRRIRLFSKFTLRCPFPVFWTPADDRSKRKYAWYKDGQRLPVHEDKYTQTDNKGELRVKGADEPDSGLYMCASLTSNPQDRTHNITVRLERVPGDPDPTPPAAVPDEDSPEVPASSEHEDVKGGGDLAPPATSAPPESPAGGVHETASPAVPEDKPVQAVESTVPPAPLPAPAAMAAAARSRRESESEADESASPSGAIEVVAARYDASPFSECSASCSSSGLRQRVVRCVNNETGAKLPLAACEDLGPPPPPQEACNRVDCPVTWQWPSWAGISCSHPCGGGAKYRQARCSQTRADGTEMALEAEACAHLGPGEERRECRRAPCRSRAREGELVRLQCRARSPGWRRNNVSLDVAANANKYLADDGEGTLYVFAVVPSDAGRYECIERAEDGTVWPHFFDVVVLPPAPLPNRGLDDDLVIRVGECDNVTSVDSPPLLQSPDSDQVGDNQTAAAATEDVAGATKSSVEEEEAGPTGPPIPWHRLFTPAAPEKGRILGVFS